MMMMLLMMMVMMMMMFSVITIINKTCFQNDRGKKFCGSESGFQLALIEDRVQRGKGQLRLKRVESFFLVENIRKGGLIFTTIRPLFSSRIVEVAANYAGAVKITSFLCSGFVFLSSRAPISHALSHSSPSTLSPRKLWTSCQKLSQILVYLSLFFCLCSFYDSRKTL